MGFNKAIVQGNLTKEIDLRYTSSGKAVCTLPIAINEGYGDKKTVFYVDCQIWEKNAENCAQFLKKGSSVLVEGRLSTRSWEKDGVKHYKTEIVASRVVFLSSPKTEGEQEQREEQPPDSDEVPF